MSIMATTVEIVLRVVGSGAVAIGVLTAYGTVRMRLKIGQSHKWPTVPGKIVSSELESETEALEVSRQKLAVESARKEFERSKSVFQKGGSVSQEDMEQKEAVWKIAIVEQQQAES